MCVLPISHYSPTWKEGWTVYLMFDAIMQHPPSDSHVLLPSSSLCLIFSPLSFTHGLLLLSKWDTFFRTFNWLVLTSFWSKTLALPSLLFQIICIGEKGNHVLSLFKGKWSQQTKDSVQNMFMCHEKDLLVLTLIPCEVICTCLPGLPLLSSGKRDTLNPCYLIPCNIQYIFFRSKMGSTKR